MPTTRDFRFLNTVPLGSTYDFIHALFSLRSVHRCHVAGVKIDQFDRVPESARCAIGVVERKSYDGRDRCSTAGKRENRWLAIWQKSSTGTQLCTAEKDQRARSVAGSKNGISDIWFNSCHPAWYVLFSSLFRWREIC